MVGYLPVVQCEPILGGVGQPGRASFSVHFRSPGKEPSAFVLHMRLGGIHCVSIRVPLFFSVPVGIPMNLEALNQVSLSSDAPDSPWAAPYGLTLMTVGAPVLSMNTALPLAELPRSQFDFALSQMLRSTSALYQVLGIDPNR